MNIFILEDDVEGRISLFKQKLAGQALFIAETAEQGIKTLKYMLSKEIPIDYIFLDHDLGGRAFVESTDDNCGMRVAEFIRDKAIQSTIILHTMNPVGAGNMKAILPDAEICPFPFLIHRIKEATV